MGGCDIFRVWSLAGSSRNGGLSGGGTLVVGAHEMDSTGLATRDGYRSLCGRDCRWNSCSHKGCS